MIVCSALVRRVPENSKLITLRSGVQDSLLYDCLRVGIELDEHGSMRCTDEEGAVGNPRRLKSIRLLIHRCNLCLFLAHRFRTFWLRVTSKDHSGVTSRPLLTWLFRNHVISIRHLQLRHAVGWLWGTCTRKLCPTV
jgi:hypothetical protein